MGEWTIGIIGGSGLYAMDALEDAQSIEVNTPWGPPSDRLTIGRIGANRFVFLPRHGRGHSLPPSQVNARANIDALKRAGCTDILAISAVGSLREDVQPGDFVLVSQMIDRTSGRERSFFGAGFAAHVSLADPVCGRLSALAGEAAEAAGARLHRDLTYLAMEGPQFSTRAESRLYRSWGCDVIGMTAMPEARLAREAELPYALLTMVTDHDSWREDVEPVEVETIVAQMNANARRARQVIVELASRLPEHRPGSPIDTCLDTAVITSPEARDASLVARLDAVCRGYLARNLPAQP